MPARHDTDYAAVWNRLVGSGTFGAGRLAISRWSSRDGRRLAGLSEALEGAFSFRDGQLIFFQFTLREILVCMYNITPV